MILVQHLFSRNFLEYNHHLTTVPFFEAIVKYVNYFKDSEQFLLTVLQCFFSIQGIRHPTKAIASPSVHHFSKLIDKYNSFNVGYFAQHAQTIAQQLTEVIQDCESGKISADVLEITDVQDLYSVIGVLASMNSVPEDLRVQLLNWSFERLSQALQQANQI